MKRAGATVCLTTHYLNEAEALCDRIAIIDRGRIVAAGTPAELVAGSRSAPMVQLSTVQPLAREWMERIRGIDGLSCQETSAQFRSATVRSTVAEVMTELESRGLELVELKVSKATLEDVFLELTNSEP